MKLEHIHLTRDQAQEMINQAVASSVAGVVESMSSEFKELKEKLFQFKDVLEHTEIALYCGVETKTVLHWIHNEGLPASKKGRKYFADKSELNKWLLSNPKKTTQKDSGNYRQAS